MGHLRALREFLRVIKASVMPIGSEVLGSCVGKIDVSVEIKNGNSWLCCGWKYSRFILGGKMG